jgi:hypothetical protein
VSADIRQELPREEEKELIIEARSLAVCLNRDLKAAPAPVIMGEGVERRAQAELLGNRGMKAGDDAAELGDREVDASDGLAEALARALCRLLEVLTSGGERLQRGVMEYLGYATLLSRLGVEGQGRQTLAARVERVDLRAGVKQGAREKSDGDAHPQQE